MRRDRRRTTTGVAVLLAALLVAACAADSGGDAETAGSGWTDGGAREWTADVAVGDDAEGTTAAPAAASSRGDADGGSAIEEAAPGSGAVVPADLGLNAGSVDDNEQWAAYLRYREVFLASGIPADDLQVEGRQVIRVVDASGQPVLGALVTVTAPDGSVVGTARTPADGRVLVFPPPGAGDPGANQQRPVLRATVAHRGGETAADLDSGADAHEVALDGDRSPDATRLDLHLLLDATGSMGDEIERLKAHMTSVAEQVGDLPGEPEVRLSLTAYRDVGDLFVTRTFDFTSDVGAFTTALGEVVADGGGDVPEALNEGLAEALSVPAWSEGEAVRLVVLVADAPPHLDRTPRYLESVQVAREMGVKILPVASSGADDQAEFVFRQLAQLTGGRFTFLTYGADGASPGDATPHHVDDYSVLSLDDLVVQLVADELAWLDR